MNLVMLRIFIAHYLWRRLKHLKTWFHLLLPFLLRLVCMLLLLCFPLVILIVVEENCWNCQFVCAFLLLLLVGFIGGDNFCTMCLMLCISPSLVIWVIIYIVQHRFLCGRVLLLFLRLQFWVQRVRQQLHLLRYMLFVIGLVSVGLWYMESYT
jgi:hypothetical protein